MSGPRQAAVTLHGYAAHDREWLLDALGEPESRVLRAYLAELDELGFSSPGMGMESISTRNSHQHSALSPATALASSSSLDLLRTASPDDMYRLLGTESCALIGQVVSMEAWAWKDDLLYRFSEERRNRILTHAGASRDMHSMGALRREFLLSALSARLKTCPARQPERSSAAPAFVAWINRLLRRAMSWK